MKYKKDKNKGKKLKNDFLRIITKKNMFAIKRI